MSRTRYRSLDDLDESLAFDHGRVDWVVIADHTIGRSIQEPGWRWSAHIRPIFEDRGDHDLRGFDGVRRLLAVGGTTSHPGVPVS